MIIIFCLLNPLTCRKKRGFEPIHFFSAAGGAPVPTALHWLKNPEGRAAVPMVLCTTSSCGSLGIGSCRCTNPKPPPRLGMRAQTGSSHSEQYSCSKANSSRARLLVEFYWVLLASFSFSRLTSAPSTAHSCRLDNLSDASGSSVLGLFLTVPTLCHSLGALWADVSLLLSFSFSHCFQLQPAWSLKFCRNSCCQSHLVPELLIDHSNSLRLVRAGPALWEQSLILLFLLKVSGCSEG